MGDPSFDPGFPLESRFGRSHGLRPKIFPRLPFRTPRAGGKKTAAGLIRRRLVYVYTRILAYKISGGAVLLDHLGAFTFCAKLDLGAGEPGLAVQVVHGALCVGRGGEDRALVVLQHLEP